MNIAQYRGVRGFLRFMSRILHPMKIEGAENIPAEGAFMLCSNHISLRDPLIMIAAMPTRYVRFMAKAELFDKWYMNKFLKGMGAFPINRGKSDLAAVREALGILKEGGALGVFPQGTRSDMSNPRPMETGAALLALRAGVPVIPALIDGPYRFFRKLRISFGKPVELEDLGRKCDADNLKEATSRIESAVWSMKSAKNGV